MPCYCAWDEHLVDGTEKYDIEKAIVLAKLESIKHIIDYYVGVSKTTWPTQPINEPVDPRNSKLTPAEKRLIKIIAHHCACDGVHFTTLYDVHSVLVVQSPKDYLYSIIIAHCAHLMRSKVNLFNVNRE
jgi:hypothetical protein